METKEPRSRNITDMDIREFSSDNLEDEDLYFFFTIVGFKKDCQKKGVKISIYESATIYLASRNERDGSLPSQIGVLIAKDY